MAEAAELAASEEQGSSSVLASVEARANRFFDLLSQLQGDDDVELVHDVRVASRRLAEGLGAARLALDAEGLASFTTWLREMRALLGPARDADVMTHVLTKLVGGEEKLGAIPAGVSFVKMLRERRQSQLDLARSQLSATEVRERRHALTDMMPGALSGEEEADADVPADVSDDDARMDEALARRARRRVRRRRSAFTRLARKAAKSSRPGALHAARIACKKLRYGLELAHECRLLDGARELKRLRGLQERLGELNDLTVLRDELARFAEQTGMDEILSLTKRRRREPVKGFAKTWPKAARRLRKAKARRLSEELAPALVGA